MAQILGQELNSNLSNKGETENNLERISTSQLHNQYSINGKPGLINKPKPSRLDLDGQKPTSYLENPPK